MSNPYVKQTWTDGSSLANKTRMEVMEQGIYDAHFQPVCRVFNSGILSIANNVATALAFDSESLNVDGLGGATMHSASTNPSRITCRVAGTYLIIGTNAWGVYAVGHRQCLLKVNGATFIADECISSVTAVTRETQMVTTMFPLAVSDYVELYVVQSTGSTQNNFLVPGEHPSLSMVRLG